MLKFEKPDYKVKEYVKDSFYGKFELEPLERGFGTTLGNALRRVMLSSLPGDAITSVKIDGVAHEFQKIDGVIEDVTAIVLNLKGVVLKNHSKDENKILRLSKNTPGVVTAGDIEADADIEILNPAPSKGVSVPFIYFTKLKSNEPYFSGFSTSIEAVAA